MSPDTNEFIEQAKKTEGNMRVAIMAGFFFKEWSEIPFNGFKAKVQELKEGVGTKNIYTNEFIKYAEMNDQNMRVAHLAGRSFQDLRVTLFDDFANSLLNELKNKGWVECPSNPVSGWKNNTMVRFRKGSWPADVYVGISPEQAFTFHDLVVVVPRPNGKDDSIRDSILKELKSKNEGKKYLTDHPNCVWRKQITTCLTDLDSPGGLIALSQENKREGMLKDVVERIEVLGNDIDRSAQQKHSSSLHI